MILHDSTPQVATIAAHLSDIGLVARLRADQPIDRLLEVGDALLAVPLTAVEIPLDHPEPFGLLAAFRQRFGAHLLIGVGTVQQMAEGREALAAGADFLIAAHYRTELHHLAERCGALYLPPVTAHAAHRALDAMGVTMATVTAALLLASAPDAVPTRPALLATEVDEAALAPLFQAGAAAIAVGPLLFPTAAWSMPAMIRTARALRQQWIELQRQASC